MLIFLYFKKIGVETSLDTLIILYIYLHPIQVLNSDQTHLSKRKRTQEKKGGNYIISLFHYRVTQ